MRYFKVFFWVSITYTLLMTSCSELGPSVNPEGTNRVVLVEEFTGVQCVNCPEGSEQIELLLGIHGDNLIAVSIHSGFFANPYMDSQYDFRTDEGAAIENLLGPAIGYPIATINRRVFPSEGEALLNRSKWAGYIDQEKAEPLMVDISLENDYDSSTRELSVTADFSFLETVSDELRISVMVTENNIVDPQLTPEGKNENYTHKHVLRGMMTNFDGNDYTGNRTQGATGSETYSMILPAEWNENNCSAVVFIHTYLNGWNVLQAAESKIF